MAGMAEMMLDFVLTPMGWVAVIAVIVAGYLAYRWTFSD